jgi:hypothetical protein
MFSHSIVEQSSNLYSGLVKAESDAELFFGQVREARDDRDGDFEPRHKRWHDADSRRMRENWSIYDLDRNNRIPPAHLYGT